MLSNSSKYINSELSSMRVTNMGTQDVIMEWISGGSTDNAGHAACSCNS